LKLTGIWFGFGTANGILNIIFIYSLLTADWHYQAEIIHKKIIHQKNLDEGLSDLGEEVEKFD
jgi:hypothetical protein